DQALLRRQPHARFRRRIVEPQVRAVQQHDLAAVPRRIDIAHEVAELPRSLVFARVDDEHYAIPGLTPDVLDERVREAERLVRIADAVGRGDDVPGLVLRGHVRRQHGQHCETQGSNASHMCLRASTTGSRAARLAGSRAASVAINTRPSQIAAFNGATPEVRTRSGIGEAWFGGVQVSPAWLMAKARAAPSRTPTLAPITPSNAPSMTNWRRIPVLRRPMARAVPISLVRSITLMLIVLTTVKSTITPMITARKEKMAPNMPITCL